LRRAEEKKMGCRMKGEEKENYNSTPS